MHLSENDLLSLNQSGFRLGDSATNQLLSVTHDIYQAFNNHHETRTAFLDISSAFDMVLHKGPLLKLKANRIDGPLYLLIENCLSLRFLRVVLNGTAFSRERILAGVPQGSILGPIFFLLYINDHAEHVSSPVKLLLMTPLYFESFGM